jgi:LPXTG-motif cell wall-anchored protein
LFVDGWFVTGLARGTELTGEGLSYAQTGRVRQYLLFTVVGLALLGGLLALVF